MGKLPLALRFIGVGFFIGGAIVLGLVLGLWLDNILDTGWVWIVGLLVGIAVAFWGVYNMLLPLLDDKNGHGRNNS